MARVNLDLGTRVLTDWCDNEQTPPPRPDAITVEIAEYPPGYPNGGPWIMRDGQAMNVSESAISDEIDEAITRRMRRQEAQRIAADTGRTQAERDAAQRIEAREAAREQADEAGRAARKAARRFVP